MERPDAKMVIVLRTWHDSEANLVAGMLRSSGIACNTVSDIPHSVYPLTTDGLGEVRLVVAEDDADEARRLIGEWRDGAIAADEDLSSADPEDGDAG